MDLHLFDRAEYLERIGRVKRQMTERGIDLLLVASPANQFWLTGYDGWSFYTPQMVAANSTSPWRSGSGSAPTMRYWSMASRRVTSWAVDTASPRDRLPERAYPGRYTLAPRIGRPSRDTRTPRTLVP